MAQISALTRAVANVSQWRLSDVFIDIASAKGEIPRREFERSLENVKLTVSPLSSLKGSVDLAGML